MNDGRVFDRYSAPMIGADAKYYGRVWFFRDITERIRAEKAIKNTEAKRFELERELIQSQKFESLGTLASGIAHDFNNILSIILGYSSMGEMKSSKLDPEIAKCFDAISLASQRGAKLVSQLLTFARKTETLFRSTDINALILEIIKLFNGTFPKTIDISTALQEKIPFINCDATQLHQVIMNLCVNARDAMPEGGVITIATSIRSDSEVIAKFPKAGARRYVEVLVSDTGTGMSDETKRKIFDPFFTTKEPGKGTGLGLAVVYSIIENHHGMIEAESELGKGARFHIYLPIDDSIVGKREPAPAHQDAPSEGRETILIIEDEVFIIEMLQTVLASQGYHVLLARDGAEGVEMFSLHHKNINVVILDLGLPKLRGDEVANRIRRIDPNSKMIMMSGFYDPEIRANLERIGVQKLIKKPFSFAELTNCLRSAIDR